MEISNIMFSHIAILDTNWKSGNNLLVVIKKILRLHLAATPESNVDQTIKTDLIKMKEGKNPAIKFMLNGNSVKFEWNSNRQSYSFIYDPLNWKNSQCNYSHIEFLNSLHLEYCSRLVLNQIYSLGFKPDNIQSQKLLEFGNLIQNEYIQIETTIFNLTY